MKLILTIGAVILLAFYLVRKLKHKSMYPTLPKKYNFGKRRGTLRRVLELLEQRQAKTLVETGIARNGLEKSKGDGASTILFGVWAKNHDAKLYSIDIDSAAVEIANKEIVERGLEVAVSTHVSDSIIYLENFQQPVDFLYLDSYDYDKRDLAVQKASQEHHLKEFKAVESRLHDQSVVLIDDCDLPGGGKGKTVIKYMLGTGWKIEMQQYQVILHRGTV